jgi:hypothetical protein
MTQDFARMVISLMFLRSYHPHSQNNKCNVAVADTIIMQADGQNIAYFAEGII